MKKKLYATLSMCLLFLVVLSLSITAIGKNQEAPDSFSVLASAEPMIKGALRGSEINFSVTDFAQALGTSDIDAITVTTLPDSRDGILKLSNMKVGEGQTIRAEYLHLLRFIPTDKDVSEASFGFTCGDYAGGTVMTCQIRIADTLNRAPSVNHEKTTAQVLTREEISVYGSLVANDPEQDELTYIITSYPQNGKLTLRDIHKGDFCYTPNEDYRGNDSFRYVVRDSYGNYSYEDSVKIKVNAREIELEYADMEGHSAYNAALTAAQNRWMYGTLSGDGMYFHPEATVTRGDFVAMAMKAAGIQPLENLKNTCFDDNESIPSSVRSYVATAHQLGYVNGSFDGDGLYFHANRAITRAEAAVIVNRMVELGTPTSAPVFSDSGAIPVWAKDDIEALFDAGMMFATEQGIDAKGTLSRADAAVMLTVIAELE